MAHRASVAMQAAAAAAVAANAALASGEAPAVANAADEDAGSDAADAAVVDAEVADAEAVRTAAGKRLAAATASLDRAYAALASAAASEQREQHALPICTESVATSEERTNPESDYPLRLSLAAVYDALTGASPAAPHGADSSAPTEEIKAFRWFAPLAKALTERNGRCAQNVVRPGEFLKFTVTFHANPANDLTCPPSSIFNFKTYPKSGKVYNKALRMNQTERDALEARNALVNEYLEGADARKRLQTWSGETERGDTDQQIAAREAAPGHLHVYSAADAATRPVDVNVRSSPRESLEQVSA